MNVLELPAEMLGKIFNHYVHDHWKGRQVDPERPLSKLRRISAYSDSQTHPVDLTHTCRLWRNTAISMPQLWATIHAFEIASEGDVKMFELWLERSAGHDGAYPLILTIRQMQSRGEEAPVQCFGEVISLAVSQHQRWRHISLSLYGDSQPFFEPLYTVPLPLSTLRGFQVDFNQWDLDGLHHLIGALCSSTALRSVQFGAGFFRTLESDLVFDIVPWDRLTTVTFRALRPSHFIRILSSSMDTLQQLSISCLIFLCRVDKTPIPYVTMRRLQSLRIEAFPTRKHAEDTFGKLFLPSLRELYLPMGFPEDPELRPSGWESLLSLLERSNCKLQTFEYGDDNAPELIENLKSPLFEHLTSLRVTSDLAQHPDVSVQLLAALSEACEETQRPRMFPLLETLILDSVHSGDSVQEMVSTRVAAYGGYGRLKLRRIYAQVIDPDSEEPEYALEMDLHERK
ncbi:hypothetical protein EST38_g5501 [Candolleomyces aberdarensis]|uniref:F-box domain-containing protein n=1 Tax=Candolleomyces aberdarensis TaxID=2316362 RepID=A0A4V1Q3Z9_9AGAR|nr:hypothetical protein EST38_g5501 [Candolleomyces aberdarensis]